MDVDLKDALATRIKTYLEAHPKVTLRALAKRSGLSIMTVSRLAQGEVLKPSFEAALALVGVVCTKEAVSDFLEQYFPETMTKFGKVYSENSNLLDHEEYEHIMSDSLTFAIFDMATMESGVHRSVIEFEFGNLGIKTLETLLQKGIVTQDENGRISHQEGLTHLPANAADLVKQLKYRLEYFDTGRLGSKAARLANLSESLTTEGKERIHDIVTECIDKIQEIRENKKYKGTLPVYVGLFMNLVVGSDLGIEIGIKTHTSEGD